VTSEVTTLANGLRIATHRMPGLETVSLGLWVATGARHEAPREHGISHLLEHMAFKGTARRTARQIAEEIENVGGDLNAATSLETTAYYARVLAGDERLALDIIADIVLDSSFAEDELEREREVILQEIAATRDSPEDISYDLMQEAAFPEQAIGRPILGTPESVARFTPADLEAFLASRYSPERMVLSAAGAVDHGRLVGHAEALFGALSRGTDGSEAAARYEGGARVAAERFEQAHLVLGFESPSYRAEEFYAAQVLAGLTGGGMSSRLFQEARERRGLCYAIYATAWGLRDTGMLAIHAATGSEMMARLMDVVAAELKALAEDGPSAAELARAKAQIKAGLLMALESSSARAEQMARQLIGHGRIIPTEESVARVGQVSRESVGDLAGRMFASRPSLAIVGPGSRSREHARYAEKVLGTAM
jgi:predicted Zn-dependent peptidase